MSESSDMHELTLRSLDRRTRELAEVAGRLFTHFALTCANGHQTAAAVLAAGVLQARAGLDPHDEELRSTPTGV